jgi:cephalosporin hydroxylase
VTVATLAEDAVGRYGASQDDWELGRLVDVIGVELAGRLVVEIGCDQGGTLWLWRELGARVVAVTKHTRKDGSFRPHGALVIEGDSTSAGVQAMVKSAVGREQVAMVFVDGGHDYETASSDIRWALRLAPRGLVVVHDVNHRLGHPEIETYLAWLEYSDDRAHMTIARRGEGSPGVGIIFPREL